MLRRSVSVGWSRSSLWWQNTARQRWRYSSLTLTQSSGSWLTATSPHKAVIYNDQHPFSFYEKLIIIIIRTYHFIIAMSQNFADCVGPSTCNFGSCSAKGVTRNTDRRLINNKKYTASQSHRWSHSSETAGPITVKRDNSSTNGKSCLRKSFCLCSTTSLQPEMDCESWFYS